VTPSSFLELLKNFKETLDKERKKAKGNCDRYANGVKLLMETNATVDNMEKEIVAKKPVLKEAKDKTEALKVDLVASQEIAQKEKDACQIEEEKCSKDEA